ncbi:Nociceptin receptor [Galemys pyrenaicus]|uniref:Nociceptin receptor n=1 Tax=Galemys pyrenaicus TaxID=202257 RepID=A0A8J6A9W7_GALPY|nr:Nociceptin receptor [Galemys pyrenaicus]
MVCAAALERRPDVAPQRGPAAVGTRPPPEPQSGQPALRPPQARPTFPPEARGGLARRWRGAMPLTHSPARAHEGRPPCAPAGRVLVRIVSLGPLRGGMDAGFRAPSWDVLYGNSSPPLEPVVNATEGAFLPLGLKVTILALYLAVCVGGLLGNCLVMYVILSISGPHGAQARCSWPWHGLSVLQWHLLTAGAALGCGPQGLCGGLRSRGRACRETFGSDLWALDRGTREGPRHLRSQAVAEASASAARAACACNTDAPWLGLFPPHVLSCQAKPSPSPPQDPAGGRAARGLGPGPRDGVPVVQPPAPSEAPLTAAGSPWLQWPRGPHNPP